MKKFDMDQYKNDKGLFMAQVHPYEPFWNEPINQKYLEEVYALKEADGAGLLTISEWMQYFADLGNRLTDKESVYFPMFKQFV